MRLTEYLRHQKTSQRAFAKRLGVTQQAANRYCMGGRIPEPEILVRIERITHGLVRVEDFVRQARQRAKKALQQEGKRA